MRTVEAIYEALRAACEERCGCVIGDSCDMAVRLYAAAAQIQALEVQAEWVSRQSFPQTAEGEMLDRHAETRGITRLAAERATGVLRFSVSQAAASDLAIPAGSVCLTRSGEAFETTEEGALKAGELSVDIPAQAVEAGAAGNAAAGRIALMSPYPAGIQRCTNPAAFTGGRDREGDESLRARVLGSFRRLPNGANAAFYETVALSHSGVAAAAAVGRARGTGTVNVYLTAPAGAPSQALLAEVEADLAARREIAVDVKVLAPTTAAVNVAAAVKPEAERSFAEVKAAVEEALRRHFTGDPSGEGSLSRGAGEPHLSGGWHRQLPPDGPGGGPCRRAHGAAGAGDGDHHGNGGLRWAAVTISKRCSRPWGSTTSRRGPETRRSSSPWGRRWTAWTPP